MSALAPFGTAEVDDEWFKLRAAAVWAAAYTYRIHNPVPGVDGPSSIPNISGAWHDAEFAVKELCRHRDAIDAEQKGGA